MMYKDYLIKALKNRDHDDNSIKKMTAREMFSEYCNWNGIIGWGDDLWNTVEAAKELEEQNK